MVESIDSFRTASQSSMAVEAISLSKSSPSVSKSLTRSSTAQAPVNGAKEQRDVLISLPRPDPVSPCLGTRRRVPAAVQISLWCIAEAVVLVRSLSGR